MTYIILELGYKYMFFTLFCHLFLNDYYEFSGRESFLYYQNKAVCVLFRYLFSIESALN